MTKLTTERLEEMRDHYLGMVNKDVGNALTMLLAYEQAAKNEVALPEALKYAEIYGRAFICVDRSGSVHAVDPSQITLTILNEPESAQPVSEPKPVAYFSYGSEHGFDWHKTEKEAIESAEAAIDDYRGDACDGWSEETDSVCWGVILQQATKVDERPRTDDDRCDPAIDTVCDYALLPAQEKNND